MKNLFFAYCPESGFEIHETLEGALDDASDSIQNYLVDGWSEEVTGVCVGEITHRAKMCDQVFPEGEIDEDGIDEAGDHWNTDWEYKCNYKMLPANKQSPAPDAAALVEALEGLLEITNESLGVSGYHLNGDIAKWSEFEEVANAEEVLALYLKQCKKGARK